MGCIISRQPEDFKKGVQKLLDNADDSRKARQTFLLGLKKLIRQFPMGEEEKAKCFTHDSPCFIHPTPAPGSVRMSVAGITCVDWSSRGRRAKTLGDSALAWAALMREVYWTKPDILILECTRLYDHNDVVAILDEVASMSPLVFSPTQVGIPSERYRKYMVMLWRCGRLQWKERAEINLPRFLAVYGRRLACNGHVYLKNTSEDLIETYRQYVSALRSLPSHAAGRSLNFDSLLTRRGRARLQVAIDHAAASGYASDDEIFYDQSQNLDFSGITYAVPALTQRNVAWSHCLRRPMLPQECFEAMGFPAVLAEATTGLRCPVEYAIENLSMSKQRSLSGNSMHFAAIGLVIVYTLAFTMDHPTFSMQP